jgi:ABC-type Mn2+/Zn2+ transport system ATPase subunit
MADSLLQVEALTVARRVREVSFALPPGSLTALTGPNGCGKSTVLDALLGLVPFTGTVTLRPDTTMAIVPQRLEAPDAVPLRVLDFLALTRTTRPLFLGVSASVRRRAEALLTQVDSVGLLERPLAELSGGQLRRVLLADALERTPALLLLDEPEVGLDAAGRRWLEGVLRGLGSKGTTTLLVTHEPALVSLATQVVAVTGAEA